MEEGVGDAGVSELGSGSGAHDREQGGVDEAHLHEEAGVVPVDVLVRDLPVLDADDHDEHNLCELTRGGDVGQQPIDGRGVREGDDELVHEALGAVRARHGLKLHVGRKELTDEAICVEGSHALGSVASDHGGDVDDVGVGGHGGQRLVEVAGELRGHVVPEHLVQLVAEGLVGVCLGCFGRHDDLVIQSGAKFVFIQDTMLFLWIFLFGSSWCSKHVSVSVRPVNYVLACV